MKTHIEAKQEEYNPLCKLAIHNAIRRKYSVDDEIAILRQRETNPEEFKEYFDFVEETKTTVKNKYKTILKQYEDR